MIAPAQITWRFTLDHVYQADEFLVTQYNYRFLLLCRFWLKLPTICNMLPRELFDSISNLLGPHSTKNLSKVLLSEETPENLLWRSIFEKDTWLEKAWEYKADPVLVSPNLESITKDPRYLQKRRRYNILFLTMDWETGDTICDPTMGRIFFECLRQDHRYRKETGTVSLPRRTFRTKTGRKIQFPKISLNIQSVVDGDEFLTLPAKTLRQCFRKDRIETQYCFADEKKIRVLENSKILGIGDMSDPKAYIPMCSFWLRNKDQPQFLKAKNCPRFRLKGEYPKNIVGWELC